MISNKDNHNNLMLQIIIITGLDEKYTEFIRSAYVIPIEAYILQVKNIKV